MHQDPEEETEAAVHVPVVAEREACPTALATSLRQALHVLLESAFASVCVYVRARPSHLVDARLT
eukprot:1160403-Pelagomonas_calceolata.AAC.1